ncbi:Crp/Fnr family transcriptional regulator [Flavihumibacter rivuli]|uniref:Crp/Fnr family transcriptional regulator n=1 Tax=Flavihumibacter rivuli TaxID=2838156 RepID=UPI001BDF0DA0|nr:Crp/Fnr family transcriptional regulator [Flavihumibacter rivuli]ULQ55887.1 Crp/Fnr family transcriptional regulator [Flavihumibacter rivuli]
MENIFDQIIQHISIHVPLTESEQQVIIGYLTTRRIKKRQFLVSEGEHCRTEHFIAKGCLRSYYVDEKGKEYLLRFATENYWITDLNSFTNNVPSTQFIEALEDSEVICITRQALDCLLIDLPKLHKYFMLIYRNAIINNYDRIQQNFSLPALERYRNFQKKYPQLEQRVPRYMIASYLGITPEFLSKLSAQK